MFSSFGCNRLIGHEIESKPCSIAEVGLIMSDMKRLTSRELNRKIARVLAEFEHEGRPLAAREEELGNLK